MEMEYEDTRYRQKKAPNILQSNFAETTKNYRRIYFLKSTTGPRLEIFNLPVSQNQLPLNPSLYEVYYYDFTILN